MSLNELLAVHNSSPFTLNSEYLKRLRIAEAKRLTKQLFPDIKDFLKKEGTSLEADILENFIVGTINATNADNMDLAAAEYTLDAMLAYYEVSNLHRQVILMFLTNIDRTENFY